MAGKSKHAARSQRSHRNGIPYGIFYYHALKDLEARRQRGLSKGLQTLLSEKKEEE